MYSSITFYKYFNFQNFQELREPLKELMLSNNVKGKIIISGEGVNGAICSQEKNVLNFLKQLGELIPDLKEVSFRNTYSEIPCFKRTLVKIRDEIVPLGVKGVTPFSDGGGKALNPSTLKEWYDNNEDFIILDARNDYEFESGRFKNSLEPNISKFRDFKKRVEELKDLKDKKIVTYCTGGIRCEKASAYMKSQGFKDVYKLDGGIIEFLKLKDSDKYWEGNLFVFDNRCEISFNHVK